MSNWCKSTRSAANGECVEVAVSLGSIVVRDSKDPRGPVLRFGTESWRDFIALVRAGRLDRPGS
ncbi:MAG: hypothetical protein QOI74_928 [Micromonosporaceae bacterium]|nr:hypothetical protein [Micromonosporaceae bacterium]